METFVEDAPRSGAGLADVSLPTSGRDAPPLKKGGGRGVSSPPEVMPPLPAPAGTPIPAPSAAPRAGGGRLAHHAPAGPAPGGTYHQKRPSSPSF